MVDTTDFNVVPNNEEEEFTVDFGEVINVGGGGGTSDFNALTNRPKYNNQTMTGDTNIPKVPAKTSDLTNDGSDGNSTYVEADELATVATSGKYTDLTDTPTIPDAQIQSNWTQSDNTKVDYIKNKPTIPTVNDATLTITQNGTSKGTFTANDSDDTTIELSDTTYSDFTGTDGNTGGTHGLVPAPATTDAGKFLKADGTWDTAGGGGPTVVQSTGTSTTDVMSQNAVTSALFADPASATKVRIGNTGTQNGNYSVSIGWGASAPYGNIAIGQQAIAYLSNSMAIGKNAKAVGNADGGVALGCNADAEMKGSVALGAYSQPTSNGEINVGVNSSTYQQYGYNNTTNRLIRGVYDGQNANDAVTVGQVNATIDAINTALSVNIPHIGAST